jgi:outer membrane protein OmpA-like peptidoglycan-associated protein
MSHFQRSRLSQIAAFASGAMVLLGGTALAQPVRVYAEAPSIEQLRSIMIPESKPGASRSIVLRWPDAAPSSSVQHAAAKDDPMPPSAAPVEPRANAQAPRPQMSAAMPRPAPAVANSAAAEPGAVAFHINFQFDSADLPVSADPMIDRIAQLMKEAPELKIRVEGHTDAVGSVPYNMELSQRRAISVAEYLVRQGIDPSRLVLVGKGMSEPLGPNPYDARNRRVQFVRVG